MKFEQPTTPSQEVPKDGKKEGLSRKLMTGLAALSLVGLAKIASERLEFTEGEEASLKDRWSQKMLKIDAEKRIKTVDHKTVHFFEGDFPPGEAMDVVPEYGVGMTIIDEGDPKVVGDEKRLDLSFVTSEGDDPYVFKNETGAETIRDGKLLDGPFGKVEYVMKEGVMVTKDSHNESLAHLNARYWTYYGLKQADMLDSPMGEYATEKITSVIEGIDELSSPADPDPKLEVLRETLTRLIEPK